MHRENAGSVHLRARMSVCGEVWDRGARPESDARRQDNAGLVCGRSKLAHQRSQGAIATDTLAITALTSAAVIATVTVALTAVNSTMGPP